MGLYGVPQRSHVPANRPIRSTDWMDDMGCRGSVVDFVDDIAGAKAVCAHCPVTRECLTYGLARGEVVGVYGGLTPEERMQFEAVAL